MKKISDKEKKFNKEHMGKVRELFHMAKIVSYDVIDQDKNGVYHIYSVDENGDKIKGSDR